MATYYVSTTGDNGLNGLSEANAWATLAYAEANAITAGDIIALKKGDTFVLTDVLAITHSGGSGTPIIWDGSLWGTGTDAIIRGFDGHDPHDYCIVSFRTCSHVTFQHIKIDGYNCNINGIIIGGLDYYSSAGTQNNEHDIIIQDCEIVDCSDGTGYTIGILVMTVNNDISNITIRRNIVNGAGAHGISIYCGTSGLGCTKAQTSNVYIGYNTVSNYFEYTSDVGYGIHINNKVTGYTIEHNDVTGSLNGECVAIDGNESTAGWFPTGGIIRYNNLHSTLTGAVILNFMDGQATTCDVYYNIITSTHAGTQYGVILNNARAWTGATVNFYNNLIYTKAGRSFQSQVDANNVLTLKNNLIINEGTNDYTDMAFRQTGTRTNTHTDNAYYMTAGSSNQVIENGSSYYARSGVATYEATAISADPQVNTIGSVWSLLITSPCRNAGTDVGLTVDYNNYSISGNPDIGALEYVPAVYYVSTSGSNSDNGLTEGTAWQTLAYAEDTAIVAGCTIALKKGDTFSIAGGFGIHHGGSAGTYITWDGGLWGTGDNAIIKLSAATSIGFITIYACSYVKFQNITVDGDNKNDCYNGITIGGFDGCATGSVQSNESYITIQDCVIKNIADTVWGSGIKTDTWRTSMSHITIQRNTFTQISNHAVAIYPGRIDAGAPGAYAVSDVYVGYNTMTKLGILEDETSAGILIAQETTRCIAEHNNIYQDGSGISTGISVGSGIGNDLGHYPTGIIIRYNYIANSNHGITFENGSPIEATVYYNKILAASKHAINVQPAAQEYAGAVITIYNNTIVMTTASYNALRTECTTTGIVTFKNNLMYSAQAGQYVGVFFGITTAGTVVHSNNLWYRTEATNCGLVVEPTPSTYFYRNTFIANYEATAVITDPKLTDIGGLDWRIASDSPARGAGVDVDLTKDYNGYPVGATPDIGAFQYGSVPTSPYTYGGVLYVWNGSQWVTRPLSVKGATMDVRPTWAYINGEYVLIQSF